MHPKVKLDYLRTLSMQMIEPNLREDIQLSIRDAIEADAFFPCKRTPKAVFQYIVSAAIGKHSERLKSLLKDCGAVISGSSGEKDASEYFWSVRFSISRAVTEIQGALAELLALGLLVQLLKELKQTKEIPRSTRIWVGDSVWALKSTDSTFAKAADFHLFDTVPDQNHKTLVGVAEVKSGQCSLPEITKQIEKHLVRASRKIEIRPKGKQPQFQLVKLIANPLRIVVIASNWELSRHFHFEKKGNKRILLVGPPTSWNRSVSEKISPYHWKIVLRWSREALANAAFEIFYWCLGNLGEQFYSEHPSPWPEMNNADAGQNAVKESLYYAINEIENKITREQAIKLYNVLGFGYALGANFRGPKNEIAMLWPQDLDEIIANGRTAKGSYIKGMV